MTRQIVTALIAGSALFAAAGEPVVLKNFTDGKRKRVESGFPDQSRRAETVHRLRRDLPLPGGRARYECEVPVFSLPSCFRRGFCA